MAVSIYRPVRGKIRITGLPYGGGGFEKRQLLKQLTGKSIQIVYVRPAWHVARNHFDALAIGLAKHYGDVELVMEYSEQELCTSSCQRAKKDTECVCVCLGTKHAGGSAASYWKEVGSELLVATQTRRVTRTLTAKKAAKWERKTATRPA
jgi:hypothetical protein